eukprot:11324133-Alexandrium_andersonii.AAC.1
MLSPLRRRPRVPRGCRGLIGAARPNTSMGRMRRLGATSRALPASLRRPGAESASPNRLRSSRDIC